MDETKAGTVLTIFSGTYAQEIRLLECFPDDQGFDYVPTAFYQAWCDPKNENHWRFEKKKAREWREKAGQPIDKPVGPPIKNFWNWLGEKETKKILAVYNCLADICAKYDVFMWIEIRYRTLVVVLSGECVELRDRVGRTSGGFTVRFKKQ